MYLGANRLIEKTVQVKPLDDFGISSVDFMKIDVEGHELDVLKGASATIGQSRSIVLIEVRNSNLQAGETWFQALNFQHFTISDFLETKKSWRRSHLCSHRTDESFEVKNRISSALNCALECRLNQWFR